jgi:uncharacterized protein YceK
MKKEPWVMLFGCVPALSGCITIATLSEPAPCNKIYSGTVGNLTDSWWLAHSLAMDIPFSLIADTVVLPYTIPKTIMNFSQDNPACKAEVDAQPTVQGSTSPPSAGPRP